MIWKSVSFIVLAICASVRLSVSSPIPVIVTVDLFVTHTGKNFPKGDFRGTFGVVPY